MAVSCHGVTLRPYLTSSATEASTLTEPSLDVMLIGAVWPPRSSRSLANTSCSMSLNSSRLKLALLEPHLRVEQPLAQHRVVVELRVGDLQQFVEHELQAVDEQRVEQEHRY